VCNNGMKAVVSEGKQPGWWWGVMRSRCSGRYGSGGGAGRRCARTRDGGSGREGKAGWAVRRPLGRLAGGPARGRGEVGHG
jgi:hypothetical protein